MRVARAGERRRPDGKKLHGRRSFRPQTSTNPEPGFGWLASFFTVAVHGAGYVSLTPLVLGIVDRIGTGDSAEARANAEFAGEVAAELGLDNASREAVEMAALLRDVGREAALRDIADKPNGPAAEDLEQYRTHPVRAAEMLERLGEPFAAVATAVRSCHERFDGGGYPDGLAGEDIPLAARIIAACDAYDSMTAGQAYGRVQDHAGAIARIWAGSGSEYDPQVVPALVRVTSRRRAAGLDRHAEADEQTPDAVVEHGLRRASS